jgi:hypothetical protein
MAFGVENLGLGKAVHVVVSVPPDTPFGTTREYHALRSKAIAALKGVGYLGGSRIFHPWRCRDSETDEPLGGMWLQAGGLAVDGPHFHATVVGWNEDPAAFYRRTGWIVHRIRVLEDESDIARVLTYSLSHAGAGKDFVTGNSLESLTWWGVFATSKLRLPLELDDAEPEDACPICGALMVRVVWIGEVPGPPREGDFLLVGPERVAIEPFFHLKSARRRARRMFREMRARGLVDETGSDPRAWVVS